MKKIILVSLIVLILFTGCTNSSNINSTTEIKSTVPSSLKSVSNTTITLEFEFGTRTGTYTGEVNNSGIPNGYGKFDSKNDEGTGWTYEGDWENGHWNGKGTTTWSDGNSYSGDYENDYENGHGTYQFEDGKKYEGELYSGKAFGKGTLYFSDNEYLEGDFVDFENATGTYHDKDGYVYTAKYVLGELSLKAEKDFFSEKERQNKYKELYESYKYTELKEYVNKYIEENSPTPLDSAYEILKLMDPVMRYEANWILTHDEFDGTNTLTFKNANEISESQSVNAYVEGTYSKITLGFVKNDWLFFDKIRISADGNVIKDSSFKSYNIQRDVIKGTLIKECVDCSFFKDNVDEMIKSNKVTIRFENTDKKTHYDRTLSKNEITAIYCSVYLEKNNRDLSNLLFRFNNETEE